VARKPKTLLQAKVATLEGTAAEKLQFVFRQLTAMTARLITTLKMSGPLPCDFKNLCKIRGKDAGELVRKCPAPAQLDLCENELGIAGAESLAAVLGQCPALAHLNLTKCHRRCRGERLRSSWRGQACGLLLKEPCTVCSMPSV
jgi:hypothetical protein